MLLDILKERVVVADGAMGTYLYSLDVPKGHCYDELSVSHPEIVQRVHREYLSAGAEIITTNTFGANPYILEKYYDLGAKTVDINASAVRIAKKAVKSSSKNSFIAGDIGPITRPFESAEVLSKEELEEIFSEQIETLVEGGVDILLFETYSNLNELLVGVNVARKLAPQIPIWASFTFVDGKTLSGCAPEEIATSLNESGVHIVGANCGRGPREILDAAKHLAKAFTGYISAMPNAGQPTFVDGEFVYPATPEYFASFARRCVSSGLSIVGGCCGTTPEHIKAISDSISGMRPRARKFVPKVELETSAAVRKIPRPKTSLEKKLASGFVLTMELDPPRGSEIGELVKVARFFKELGGDGVNIADLPMARLKMSALGLAAAIRIRTGLDIILHFTARDRNLIGMQSDLLSAYALGIDNILALRGDPPAVGDYPFATGVFDISTYGLVKLISLFNEGRDFLKNPLEAPTSFFIGVAFNQNAPSFEQELERLNRKIEAGAHFVQTQPIFQPKKLEKLAAHLNGKNIPIIASILPLVSSRHAEFLHNEIPGITIPEKIRERMTKAGRGKNARDEGIAIAKEMLAAAREIANGVCIMPQLKKFDMIEKIIL